MRLLAGILTLALAAAGCNSGGGDGGEPAAGDGSEQFTASIELVPDHTLVGRLSIETDSPVIPEIEVVGDERTFAVPVSEAATEHEIPVVGLRAEQDYVVFVRAGDEEVSLDLRTGAVPDDFPDFDIAASDPERMSEGFTMFNLLGLDNVLTDDPEVEEEPTQAGFLVAVDSAGEVVWYHRTDHPIGDVRQLDDGTILHEYNDTGARRIDLFGRTLEEWGGRIILGPLEEDSFGRQVAGDDAVAVDTDAMHHEVRMLDNGNLVTLSTELLTYDGFDEPLCDDGEGFDGSYDLIADVVVEFTPDGEIVDEFPLADHLDPVDDPRDQNVCGLPFDGVFPNWLYRAQGNASARDWTHANGVVPDPSGEAFTVSVRHMDAILQIDRATGELLWRLGPGGDFEVDHPSDLPSYQHAPEWQDDGTLLLYDNGNRRAPRPGDPDDAPPFSRAIQYRLDPEAGTAEVVWERASTVDGELAFASFVGDADRLENGNVLITDGGYADRPDRITAQITEVVPDDSDTGGETVFELRVADPDAEIAIYRAERVPSFYPG